MPEVSTQPSPRPRSHPSCSMCDSRMVLTRVEFQPARDLRHFRCRLCEQNVAVELPLNEH